MSSSNFKFEEKDQAISEGESVVEQKTATLSTPVIIGVVVIIVLGLVGYFALPYLSSKIDDFRPGQLGLPEDAVPGVPTPDADLPVQSEVSGSEYPAFGIKQTSEPLPEAAVSGKVTPQGSRPQQESIPEQPKGEKIYPIFRPPVTSDEQSPADTVTGEPTPSGKLPEQNAGPQGYPVFSL